MSAAVAAATMVEAMRGIPTNPNLFLADFLFLNDVRKKNIIMKCEGYVRDLTLSILELATVGNILSRLKN